MERPNRTQRKKSSGFDAWVDSWPSPAQGEVKGILNIKGREVPAIVYRYDLEEEFPPERQFVRIQVVQPLALRWNDSFKLLNRRNRTVLFQGRVLLPESGESGRKMGKQRRLALLRGLECSEKEMVLAKTRTSGVQGLTERELVEFSFLTKDVLLDISKQLEEEGKIRILSFSPLFLLAQDSFDFLCERVLSYLSEFHDKHPEDFGVSPEKVQRRFGLPPRVLALVLKHLSRAGRISENAENVALRDFYPLPSAEEEGLLKDMEKMYLDGELRSVSLGELQKRFGLSQKKLNRMLSFLVERRKIVLGREGFFLHSKWLDEVIQGIRSSGKRELRVSEFKQMTGLTRKYAIPLLELLDQLGVTRRKGPVREIIRDGLEKSQK